MKATQDMLKKVVAAISRNQMALRRAVNMGRGDVAELCGKYHFRLRRVEEYLNDRQAR